jgi:hypothetical protein
MGDSVIVVIQCAASKAHGAGHLLMAPARVPVIFVAHPEIAPVDDEHVHARPDDDCGGGKSWRDVLMDYNNNPGGNSLGLLPAYRLYANPVYERLVDKLDIASVYILSAGWGLIRGDFLTPYYDITFSASARGDDAYKRRRKADRHEDFRMLPDETADEVLFFGGKDYIPLFCKLSAGVKSKRTVFYSSARCARLRAGEVRDNDKDELALRVCELVHNTELGISLRKSGLCWQRIVED